MYRPQNTKWSLWVVGVSDALRGTASYRKEYWHRSSRIKERQSVLLTHAQTENIKHFEQRAVSGVTARMLSVWIVATCYWARNTEHGHLSPYYQGSSPCLWTLNRLNFRRASSLFTEAQNPQIRRKILQLHALLKSGTRHKAHNATKYKARDYKTVVCCVQIIRRKNSMIAHVKDLITYQWKYGMNIRVTHSILLLLRLKCVM
jgi:hypothetical protein